MIIFYYIILTIFLILAGLLCLIIMMQEGKGSSLGAFLGGDSQDSLFGVATAAVLKKITAYMATIFMLLSLILSFWTASIGKNLIPIGKLEKQVEETTNDD